jgi:hypothetical protein
MNRKTHLLLNSTAGVLGAATLAYAGYAIASWIRYGRFVTGAPANPLLDRFLPEFEIDERWETEIDAPVATTFEVATHLNLMPSPIIRAIFRGRELILGGHPEQREPAESFVDEARAIGWQILSEEPGRSIVLGAVTKPWQSDPKFIGVSGDQFAAFNDQGFAKIVFTLEADPLTPSTSVFRTSTRVATTDPVSRKRFRLYWSLLSPGIRIIRYEMLRLIRSGAEREVAKGRVEVNRRFRRAAPAV